MYRFLFSLSALYFALFFAPTSFAFFNLNPDLPPPNNHGDPCLSYVAKDGCNTCGANGSCTEMGCGCPSSKEGKECREKLQSRALTCLRYGLSRRSEKLVAPLEGKHMGKCLRALLPTQVCTVNTTSDYTWSCRDLSEPIPNTFDSPLCMENGKGQPINREEYKKLFDAARQHKMRSRWYETYQTESFCMKWENHCKHTVYHYYPPQTKFHTISSRGISNTSKSYNIYSGREHMECHRAAEEKPNKNECMLPLTLKDFPPIDFTEEDSTLNQFSIDKEEQCVRYENKCHRAYLALDESPEDSGKLIWRWFDGIDTACSRQERQDTLSNAMTCTSNYKPYSF